MMELLLAFVSADFTSGTNTTVTSITGAGLTWALVRRTNVQRGTAEIWRAFASGPVTNASVTAARSLAEVRIAGRDGVRARGLDIDAVTQSCDGG